MSAGPHKIWVEIDGKNILVEVDDLNQRPVVAFVEGIRFEINIEPESDASKVQETLLHPDIITHSVPAGTSCEVSAPMPGDITKIHVQAGQVINVGDPLCVLDAMKMKNTIHAPQGGTIKEVCIQEGQAVEFGVVLFRLG